MKFTVLKNEDIRNALEGEDNADLRDAFNTILHMVAIYRDCEGKNPNNTYLVVNTDEPYADEVKAVIEKHEGEKVTFE